MGMITIDYSGVLVRWCARDFAGTIAITVIGLVDCGGGLVGCSDWLNVRSAVVVRPRGVRILNIRRAQTGSSSLDAAPVSSLCLCIA